MVVQEEEIISPGVWDHKYNLNLERNDYPSEATTLPKSNIQKKINFFFKPYNGDQEFANFMRFKDNDSN